METFTVGDFIDLALNNERETWEVDDGNTNGRKLVDAIATD